VVVVRARPVRMRVRMMMVIICLVRMRVRVLVVTGAVVRLHGLLLVAILDGLLLHRRTVAGVIANDRRIAVRLLATRAHRAAAGRLPVDGAGHDRAERNCRQSAQAEDQETLLHRDPSCVDGTTFPPVMRERIAVMISRIVRAFAAFGSTHASST
jgi:hypothetical protein